MYDPNKKELTPREREILRWVAKGETSKGIARELDISPQTVDSHRARLKRKLDARNLADLIRIALENNS